MKRNRLSHPRAALLRLRAANPEDTAADQAEAHGDENLHTVYPSPDPVDREISLEDDSDHESSEQSQSDSDTETSCSESQEYDDHHCTNTPDGPDVEDNGWKIKDIAALLLYVAKQAGISDGTLGRLLTITGLIANHKRHSTAEGVRFPDTVHTLKAFVNLEGQHSSLITRYMCPNPVQTKRVRHTTEPKIEFCFATLAELPNSTYYCEECDVTFTKKEVNKDGRYFVSRSLRSIMEITMGQFGRFTAPLISNDDALRDVADGRRFKQLNATASDLAIVMHSDGAQLSKSTNKKLYVMFTQCINVSLHLRLPVWFLHTAWAGTDLPKDREPFLSELVQQAQTMQRSHNTFQPVNWQNKDAVDVESQVFVHSYLADAPERSATSGQLSHSAKQSCLYCLQIGESINHRICFKYQPDVESKTDDKLRQAEAEWQTMSAKERRKALESHSTAGFKRPTVLSKLENFDLVQGYVLDIMHQFDEGVARYLVGQLWEAGTPASLSQIQRKQVLTRWLRIIVAGHHNRPPRDLKEYKRMKAHELRFFIQHGAPVVLKDILDKEYYKVYCYASRIIWLCTKDEILQADLDELRDCCNLFLHQFQSTFGIPEMKYSIHLVQHIPLAVELFGPLHILSCYGPENHIGKISRKVLAMNNTAKNIMNTCNIMSTCAIQLNEVRNNGNSDKLVVKAVNKVFGISKNTRLADSVAVKCTFIGKADRPSQDHKVLRILSAELDADVTAEGVLLFSRCRVNNGIFVRTRIRNETYSRNESIIFTNDEEVFMIEYLIAVLDSRRSTVTDSFACGYLLHRTYELATAAGTRSVKVDHVFTVRLQENTNLLLLRTQLIQKQMIILDKPEMNVFVLSPPSNQFVLS